MKFESTTIEGLHHKKKLLLTSMYKLNLQTLQQVKLLKKYKNLCNIAYMEFKYYYAIFYD
jgi:hypothetical protein